MGITISDIKRAVSSNGDVSAYARFWHQALGNPSVPSLSSLEGLADLPDAVEWLQSVDESLALLVADWAEQRDNRPLPATNVELTLVGLAPYGRNAGRYLEHVIDEVRPDIIALDISPLDLSAHLLYSFSLPCAIGLPARGDIVSREGREFYTSEDFHPGNTYETAIIKSWLGKTPLLAVGVPQLKLKYVGMDFEMGYLDETIIDREMSKASVLAAYQSLDASLSAVSRLEDGDKMTRDVSQSLLKTVGSKMREILVEDACYIASRLGQIATYSSSRGEKARLMAIIDITHYSDVGYVLGLLKQGVTDEVYVPPKGYAPSTALVLVDRDPAKLNEMVVDRAPDSNLTQKLFHREFDRLIKDKDGEILEPAEVDRLIAEIVSRTRTHPDIARGASVRGTIAFREVVQGLTEMQHGLTRDTINRAALITLPPRILGRQKGNETAIVSDITKEVLYDIRFSRVIEATATPAALGWLSPADIAAGLNNLRPLSPGQTQALTNKELPAIIAPSGTNQEMLKHLEAMKFLKKGEPNRYSFTRKAVEYLMEALEQKLRSGSITAEEYKREKDRLMAMLPGASPPQFKMSARELANTVMELMDAQDRQWSAEMSFERMHIYYHIKANGGRDELSPQKRDYYGLRTLIDDLENQGILRATDTANGFTLTGEARNTRLEYGVARGPGGGGRRCPRDLGKMLVPERKPEIRRYSSGDLFRDISVRHTLKQIARQKK
ncbi:MAG: hypothetical protein Q7K41_02250, partial [Dehalococcoidales bacterium]|nr:hypothetical protein [Dehalococcoidales bacterium]